ncbi:KH domain containing protein [Naviculisporaceae sp. PSN 640]
MNKLANMSNWQERMRPNFGMSRTNMGTHAGNPHPKIIPQPGPPIPIAQPAPDAPIQYSFNVPFASDLAGPDTEDILHATADAVMRWTHPEDAADDVPVYQLPVHCENLSRLRALCRDISIQTHHAIEATVISTTPKNLRRQVTTVCLSGPPELVYSTRETILNQVPLSLRCTTVDVDGHLVCNLTEGVLRQSITDFLDQTSKWCGVDIFLLGPKLTPVVDGMSGDVDLRRDQRWRIAIYGDALSSEHAKTRVLIKIDQLLSRVTDAMKVDFTLNPLICGRNRKNIKLVESATGTAIYFPPLFSHVYRYVPLKAHPRDPQDVFITGEKNTDIEQAKQKVHELISRVRLFVKDVQISPAKIDNILLTRMDKIKKIMEVNGTFILFPPLGSRQNTVRIQATENLHVERTVRELMTLVGQFYTATWCILNTESRQLPNPNDIKTMLGDICANSDADVSYDKSYDYEKLCDKYTFTITGSDEAVKAALMVISQVPFIDKFQYQIRVKIELANEHKEFVSGKKNGKINKIMGQSNVQIMFDNFGEYNFHIDVLASTYDSMNQGLSLVEQEMPASISFHVPDQYHKRIIGIGGQHIQRIMKKHSVFVKFSNAMDRGGMGREDDDGRVDNVICRTPARNADSLEACRLEILDMVDRADSEITTQVIEVDRLYHRRLLSRLSDIENLEKQYNCKIVFPSTEQASDEVTVTGPQWQITKCVDGILQMVPDQHEVVMERSPALTKLLESPDFKQKFCAKLKKQYEIELTVQHSEKRVESGTPTPTVTLVWAFTKNNAGCLRDAMESLQTHFATAGVEPVIIKGAIPRPRSDTFEESLQHFDSKLLQHVPAPVATDSPTKPTFGDEVARERSTIFDRLRKPGSMSSISSFLDRRKNSSHAAPNSLFKGSRNVSKSSLISIESTRSFNADRNPWNDSGINLTDDDSNLWGVTRGYHHNGVEHKLTVPGDATPRHATRQSADSGRPSTSHSTNSGYPGPLSGPFR